MHVTLGRRGLQGQQKLLGQSVFLIYGALVLLSYRRMTSATTDSIDRSSLSFQQQKDQMHPAAWC